jgi:hypothetical protein
MIPLLSNSLAMCWIVGVFQKSKVSQEIDSHMREYLSKHGDLSESIRMLDLVYKILNQTCTTHILALHAHPERNLCPTK